MNSKTFLTFLMLGILGASNAMAATSPSSAILRVYRAFLSENGDCSNPVLLVDNGANAEPFDMQNSPTIGEGYVAPKNYQCLIIEMSDHITFRPIANDGVNCVAGTAYDIYVCQAGNNTKNASTGATVACTGTQSSGEDRVWVYISRNSSDTTGAGTNAFTPPTSVGDTANGINLASEIDVTKGGGAFIFNLQNKISDAGASCDMDPPLFGFRSN